MPDTEIPQYRLTHRPFMSSDELVALMEENVEDYAIIVTDTERQIINWSRGADAIFGYLIEEVLGKNAALIFTPEDRSASVPDEEFQTASQTGRAMDERYHLKKDGSRFWASGILTALREENGTLRGFVKILRDMTDRKRLEERLREETETAQRERERAEASAREVERLNGLLRQAMTEAHHRIKNSFQMHSALLDMERGSEEEDISDTNYTRLSLHIRSLATIHDLLTGEAKTATEFDTLNARPVFENLTRLMQQTAGGRAIHAEVDDISLPLNQATSLAPLVSEIIINALKHGKGDISVTLRREDNLVRLQVCDAGPGFPDGFTPTSAGHTGLELIETITRHDLRGATRYENLSGGGAQVTVTFPVDAPF